MLARQTVLTLGAFCIPASIGMAILRHRLWEMGALLQARGNLLISRPRLGQRLGDTMAPQALLPTVAETVARALRLPYAANTGP